MADLVANNDDSTMADLIVTNDLKSKFSQFDDIAQVTANLRSTIDQINNDNSTAGGKDDQFAKAYHQQIDQPTSNISDLVDSIRQMFGLTAGGGSTAADLFNTGEDDAANNVSQW